MCTNAVAMKWSLIDSHKNASEARVLASPRTSCCPEGPSRILLIVLSSGVSRVSQTCAELYPDGVRVFEDSGKTCGAAGSVAERRSVT